MSNDKFKYLFIYNQIKEDLLNGKYKMGSTMPTENELVEIYSASKTTVRHAMKMLAEDKYVDIQQGRGTQVLEFAHNNIGVKYENLENISVNLCSDGDGQTSNIGGFIELVSADEDTAAHLNIEIGTKVYRMHWLQLVDGRVYGYALSNFRADYLPVFDRLQRRPASRLYDFFKEHCGLQVSRVSDRIDAVTVNDELARHMGLKPGDPIIALRRTGYCDKGPFEYSTNYMRPDIFQITISMNEDYFYNNSDLMHVPSADGSTI